MSTVIDQKSYLQKYLNGPSKEKKKKKKKAIKGKGFKIIDDDIDLTKLRPLDGDELDIFDEGEDAPQIAGIVDERPEELRKLEQFKTSSKWRVINQDDGFNSKLQIEEIQKDVKQIEKENEVVFGKMYSDSEDEQQKNDSDMSPPRKKQSTNDDSDVSPPRKKQSNNADGSIRLLGKRNLSPKRKETKFDSDILQPRKEVKNKEKERLRKPSRWGESDPVMSISPKRNDSRTKRIPSSDLSPPRNNKNLDSDSSPPRKRRSHQNSSKNRSPSSDLSPPRKINRRKSPSPRKKSPERYKRDRKDRRDLSNKHRRRHDSDSDLSPPRKDRDRNTIDRNKNMSECDRYISKDKSKHSHSPRTKKNDSDSDLSPPRKGNKNMSERDRVISDRDKNRQKRNSDSPPPTNKRMAKTLEGKMAGLQDARQLREENEEFRRKEDEVFRRLGDAVSGRNAQAVSRKSKRETSEDRQKQKDKAERQKELDAKYKVWSKGLKQVEAHQERIQDFIHEASKPVARHRDDADLERSLKQVEREGDPMLQYMREKKRERGELPPERPSYKGSFPPNRFNIRPGYRWDGVDRSNGYESKYFQQQNKRKAQEEEAYKWSTEDL